MQILILQVWVGALQCLSNKLPDDDVAGPWTSQAIGLKFCTWIANNQKKKNTKNIVKLNGELF